MATPFDRLRGLSFQTRLTLVAATAVAAVVAIAVVAIYFVAQAVLIKPIDDSLHAQAAQTTVNLVARPGGLRVEVDVPQEPFGGSAGYYQVLTADGKRILPDGESTALPVTNEDRQVVSGDRAENAYDYNLQGTHIRILTVRITDNLTLQSARRLTDVDQTLGYLKLVLFFVAAGGVALAALLGRLIATAGLRPIYRLRQAVDHVTETGDMTRGVPYTGEDELGRLGAHFNRMLGALDQSLRTQRQLVADASHELRTPLASLRTNIEVLQRSPNLVPAERDRLLNDVIAQVVQLTRLIQDLIDLARGDQAPQEMEEVRLDWIVAAAVDRATTNWPAVAFRADMDESVVVGQADRLDRAISNLLDNAGKWSPAGQTVEVRVVDHEVTVRDHGPGIDRADLPHVFDRFWRAPAARGMPGSGLGLSIVRQVAESHGGTVTAELPADGGTLMRLRLPNGLAAHS
ncbi:MAG TPA: HAMP domain-containing sensor histidine kinase [Candidatus Dormibacteraeota bacterium]|nr:HAMP domain-containing sensor histidine kinase [Candidatus Dormibacteraeota bacterium]